MNVHTAYGTVYGIETIEEAQQFANTRAALEARLDAWAAVQPRQSDRRGIIQTPMGVRLSVLPDGTTHAIPAR